MVTKPTSDDRVVHDWLIRLVLEITVPAGSELWAWPLVHHCELVLCRANLDTSFDTIGSKWSCPIEVPLVKDFLLDFRITTGKVVEGLHMWLDSVCREGKIVVLEVQTDTWKIDERFNTSFAELLWVTNTRSLKDEWRTESTSGNNDLLPGSDNSGSQLSWRKGLGWNNLDANGTVAFKDYLFDLVVDHQVQILVNGTSAVDIGMGRVRSSSGVTIDPLEPVLSPMSGDQILKIIGGRNTLGFGGSQEILLDWIGVVAEGDLDWPFKAV